MGPPWITLPCALVHVHLFLKSKQLARSSNVQVHYS